MNAAISYYPFSVLSVNVLLLNFLLFLLKFFRIKKHLSFAGRYGKQFRKINCY